MENELRNAFDKIHADDALKIRTARYLKKEITKRSQAKRRPRFKLAAVCAAVLLFVVAGSFSYNLFFTPIVYVDMDVNPSIGLTLNRFDRVIETYSYNDDGANILSKVNIRFKKCDEAVRILLDAIIVKGYFVEDGLISVSVQAGSNSKNDMLEWLNEIIAVSLTEHHASAETDVFSVTDDVRIAAYEHHLTPAKYLAICELQAIDPTVTFEGCAGHSIVEIREYTRSHGDNHHNGGDDSQTPDTEHEPPKIVDGETEEHHGQAGINGNGEHTQENGGGHNGENGRPHSTDGEHEQPMVDESETEKRHDELDSNVHTPNPSNGNNDGHHGSGNAHH